jgi:hypothetical protein
LSDGASWNFAGFASGLVADPFAAEPAVPPELWPLPPDPLPPDPLPPDPLPPPEQALSVAPPASAAAPYRKDRRETVKPAMVVLSPCPDEGGFG